MRRLIRLLAPPLAACLIALAPSPAAGQLLPYAGPVDVTFVIDDTASMVDAIASLKASLPAILDRIEGMSDPGTHVPDYRLALVTFKDDIDIRLTFSANDRDAFLLLAATLSASAGGNVPEASDEALNTVIHAIAQRNHQNVDFSPAFRQAALKIIVLLTDSPPGGFDDQMFQADVDNAHLRATEAAAAAIKIAAIFTPQTETQQVLAEAVMKDYADTTGGAYAKPAPADAGAAILNFFSTYPPINRPPIAACAPVVDAVSCPADANIDAGSWDPDGTIVLSEQSPPGPYDQPTTDVTLTVTDDAGGTGSCQATVTVSACGPQPPTIQAPTLVSVEASGPAGAIATFDVTAADDQGNVVPASCLPESGSLFPLGASSVTCIATDTHGLSKSETFAVDVVDTTPPTLHGMPGDATIAGTSQAGAVYAYTMPTADDSVDLVMPVTCTPASNSLFAVGTTTVGCTATDHHGNAASGGFTVTVTPPADTIPPVVTVSSPSPVEASGPTGAHVTFSASATDNLDGSLPVSCTHASGALFSVGPTTVTCSATDAHHNTGLASFTVSVVDHTPPVLSLPAPITTSSINGTTAIVTFTATASDLVDGAVLPVCAPASGSSFPIGPTAVMCTATDAHGNVRTGSFAVTVTTGIVMPPIVRCVRGDNPGGHNVDDDEAGFYRVEASAASDGAAIRISLGAFELSNPETIKITKTRSRTEVRLMNTMNGMRHFQVPLEFEIVIVDRAGRRAAVGCGDDNSRRDDRRDR